MTWVLHFSGGFGPFFPDGEFVERNEIMEAEFDRVATPEMQANRGGELVKFKHENALNVARPKAFAEPFQQEKTFVLERAQKQLGDIFDFGGVLAVSAPVKQIIEGFEPKHVQFWPIEILNKRGKLATDKDYFMMLVVQSRDTFRPDLSVEGSYRTTGSYSGNWHVEGHKKTFLTGLALEGSKRDGAHLWYEERILTPLKFFSDALSAELRQHEFVLPPKFLKITTV